MTERKILHVEPGEGLAPYAAWESLSRGRVHAEEHHPYRGEFQRDRPRIVHSTAFRRLMYKTQVFVNHEGDHYRTRLTHSLEVAQIARTVAQCLGLNEQLVEAICLAHDLGHTPFGHAGQDALNACMKPWGGFEHNLQSLRVVDELEERYADFRGLNLSYETREGILKHCSRANARRLGELGERFLKRRQPGLEAQLANIADEIAYNNHALIHETVRRMINEVVTDLVETSRTRLETSHPADIEAVRQRARPLIGFSRQAGARHKALKKYLNKRLYRHERVQAMTRRAQEVVQGLFETYMGDLHAMPGSHMRRARDSEQELGDAGRARAVADYVAGMTDRYALSAFARLTGADMQSETMLHYAGEDDEQP